MVEAVCSFASSCFECLISLFLLVVLPLIGIPCWDDQSLSVRVAEGLWHYVIHSGCPRLKKDERISISMTTKVVPATLTLYLWFIFCCLRSLEVIAKVRSVYLVSCEGFPEHVFKFRLVWSVRIIVALPLLSWTAMRWGSRWLSCRGQHLFHFTWGVL